MMMFVYMTENLINGKKYIGQHVGEEADNYLGSGTILNKAIKKHGRENFKRTILEVVNEKKQLDQKETEWIAKFDAVNRTDFYNLTEGGTGGNTLDKLTPDQLNSRSEKIKTWFDELSDVEKIELSKTRSKNQKEQRKDQIKEIQRIEKFKGTLSARSIEWKEKRYRAQRGSNHYCARSVVTPKGKFSLASDAAKEHDVCLQTILNRCKHINFKDWNFDE
tara:strand:+ start:262 stop:921 length:660 start_codon:yes stop_codon:yes gene_type:complete